MRAALIFTAALTLATPVFAQTTTPVDSTKSSPMAAPNPQAPTAKATTTPGTLRPGDADVRASNKKGGTGGANSTNNGG